MKRSILILAGLLIGLTLLLAPKNHGKISEPYEYPVIPGMEEWEHLGTHEKRVEVCQIPEDILKSMTTEALILSIMEYPLAVDFYAYDTAADGYRVLREQFSAIKELEIRLLEEGWEEYVNVEAVSSEEAEEFDEFFMKDLMNQIQLNKKYKENNL